MRARSHVAVWVVGLAALFALRYLPPDTSLARVRQSQTLTVCHPASLPPYFMHDLAAGRVDGLEAQQVLRLAEVLGVHVQWNPQVNWYVARDPSAWGIRKGSCDLLAGGIADTDASRGLLVLSIPYLRAPWALVSHRPPQRGDRVGLWAPYLGLDRLRLQATDLLMRRGFDPYFPTAAEEAVAALDGGQLTAVLTDEPTARWLAERLARPGAVTVDPEPALPAFSLAAGFWKGDVTLKRAVNRALQSILDPPREQAP